MLKFMNKVVMYTAVFMTKTTNGNAKMVKFGQKVFFQKSQKFSYRGALTCLPPPVIT